MIKKRLSFSLVVILSLMTINFFGENKIIIKNKWQTIKRDEFLLSNRFSDTNENYILYFRAVDCITCIKKAINTLKKRIKIPVCIFGYIHNNEIELYSQFFKNALILKDKNYTLYQKLKLKKMFPVILKINKKREVIKTIGYFELKEIKTVL